jgi:hypothetical protein
MIWAVTGCTMRSTVVGIQKLRKVLGPSTFLLRRQALKKIMKCAVKPFTLCVALWVVRCCAVLLYTIISTQFLNDCTLEIPALVRMDPFRCAVLLKPLLDQHFGNCGCFLIFRGYC